MEQAESETIILLNSADRKDGFFTIWTNRLADARKIARRLDLEVDIPVRHKQGVYWGIKYIIPITYHSPASLGIKNRRGQGSTGVKWEFDK